VHTYPVAYITRPHHVTLVHAQDVTQKQRGEGSRLHVQQLQRLLEDFPEKTMICVSHRKQVATLFTRRIDVKRGGHVRMLEGSE
jgi:ABC-type lipoprotein export system ATPase subunit